MPRALRINRIAVHRFGYEVADLAHDEHNGFNQVYRAGSCLEQAGYVLTIGTDAGVVGEYVGGNPASYAQVSMFAQYLLGRDPLERERIYNDLKRGLRKHDRMGMGPVDIALWDIAGKLYDAPISQLLGGFRRTLPAYASTYHGDDNGGLTTPEAFGEFAAQCRAMGYPAFKIHGWSAGPIEREVATVLATRRAVGDGMDLMLDPACEYNTWSDALKVGLACDEARFMWLEDPYKDGGTSAFGHRKLRQVIKTPILIGEHIRGHELHVDNIVADGTDFVRADADYDCGITGLMKIAHSAEGFGLDVEIHAPGPAHRHCMAAIRNTNYYELGLVHPNIKITKPAVYASDYSDELEAVDANGHVRVPDGPGLGAPVDWDWVRAHQIDQVVYE
ncbi:MAG: mandelate racemase [Chloroflexota bacterium]|nr:mandelate racemase [Chloroflexota bacterium]